MRFSIKELPLRLISRPGFSARFWEKTGSAGDCLLWRGQVSSSGYGYVTIYGDGGYTCAPAHRVAYALAVANPPTDKLVLHSCDNKLCCNPKHLRLGTHADNRRDALVRHRGVKFTPAQVSAALAKLSAGSPKTAVAREIGCSVETLRNWETAAPTYVNPMVARE